MVFLTFQFQNASDSLLPKGAFLRLLPMAHTTPSTTYCQNLCLKRKILAHTETLCWNSWCAVESVVIAMAAPTHISSFGVPTSFVCFLSFVKQQQPTLLLSKLLIYFSRQFLTRLHLLLPSGTISHAPQIKLILWRSWCWFAFSLICCWIQYIMNTEIWRVSMKATWGLRSLTAGTFILFSAILFLFIILILVYGFSVLTF